MMPARKDLVSLVSLPSEILTKIFSYLSVNDLVQGVRKTCQCFYHLSWAVPLWKIMKVDKNENPKRKFGISQNDFYLSMLGQKCLRNSNSHEQEGGKRIDTLRGNRLTVRHVVTTVIENKIMSVCPDISVIGRKIYPNLRCLKMSHLFLPQLSFLSRYGGLLHLELLLVEMDQSGVKRLFEVLRKALTELQTLQISTYSEPNTDAAVSVKNYFCSSPKLRRICLMMNCSDDIVDAIVLHCSQLEELDLKFKLTAEAFRAVSKSPNLSLSSLKLRRCCLADNKLLRFVARGFPNLKKVSLFLLPQNKICDGMRYLLKRCSQLTHLNLSLGYDDGCCDHDIDDDDKDDTEQEEKSDSEPETDTDKKHFLYILAHGKTQRNLHWLSLENFPLYLPFYPDIFQNHHNLQTVKLSKCVLHESVIQAMANNCPLLQGIRIKRCKGICISTRTLSALLTLPHLQRLQIDEESLLEKTRLVRDGPPRRKRKLESREANPEARVSRLQDMSIPSSSFVFTPVRLELFERTCRGLQSLKIYENRFLDDDDMKIILRCCVHLQKLTLLREAQKHGNLTDITLHNIEIYGEQLNILFLPHSQQISFDGLVKLVAQSPSLTYFRYATSPAGREYHECHNESDKIEEMIKSKLAKAVWDPNRKVDAGVTEGSQFYETDIYFNIHRSSGSGNTTRSLKPRKKLTI